MHQVTPKKKKLSDNKNNSGNDNMNSELEKEMEVSNAQTQKDKSGKVDEEVACFCCGNKTSRLWKCERKDKIPHNDWHKPEYAPKDDESKSKVKLYILKVQKGTTVEFSGAQCTMRVEESHEILDSGSIVTLSTKRNKMKDLKSVQGRVVMSTNNGDKGLEDIGDWKEWGQSYLCESALTDIVSVSDAVERGFRVIFGSSVKKRFYVINPKDGSSVRFPVNKGLYVRDNTTPANCHFTSMEGYIQRQVDREKAARKFYNDLNAENVENVKYFIRSNKAKDAPITTECMKLAKKIFGLDITNTEGKWVKQKPKVVRNEDDIELPTESDLAGKEMDLAIDVVYINREALLHAVNRTIKEPTCVILGTYNKGEAPTSETLYRAIDEGLQKYNRVDVRIGKIHVDNEFRSVLKDLLVSNKWDVDVN